MKKIIKFILFLLLIIPTSTLALSKDYNDYVGKYYNIKNDEKVKNFEKAIRTAGNQLIELGENWLEEDEMNAYQLKKVEEMVKQTKKMLAKL